MSERARRAASYWWPTVGAMVVASAAWYAWDAPVRAAKAAVAESLRDPSSAEFRGIRRVGKNVICGEVNGRTVFGGYAGFRRFAAIIVDGKAHGMIASPDDELRSPDRRTQEVAKTTRDFVASACD